jgi:hypothetical protein
MTKRVQRFDSSDPPKRFQRFDFSSLSDKPTRTQQGFLCVSGNLTRTGVLEYKRADGSTFKELRLPEEVFNAESLESLKGASITDLHSVMVTPQNVKSVQVGFVKDDVREDAQFVKGTLVIQDENAIQLVEKGDRRELSPGYTCFVENASGVYQGERYDGIQRGIVYNHLAILPKGGGRSGSEVALHMDGIEDGAAYQSGEPPKKHKQTKKEVKDMKIKIHLDGVDYEIEIAEPLASNFQQAIAKLQTERSDAKERVSTLEGEQAAGAKEVKELKEKLDAAQAPEVIEKAVNERVELVEKVKKLDPEIKTDGKTARELKVEALKKRGYEQETFDGKEDSFVNGVFTAEARKEPEAAAAADGGADSGARSVGAVVEPKTDGADGKKTARERMIERNQELYKKRLDASKDTAEA